MLASSHSYKNRCEQMRIDKDCTVSNKILQTKSSTYISDPYTYIEKKNTYEKHQMSLN